MQARRARSKNVFRSKNSSSMSNKGESSFNSYDQRQDHRQDHRPKEHNRQRYQQLIDKYVTLARESLSSGDRVNAEFNYQHADHYLRLLNERNQYERNHPPAPLPREANSNDMDSNNDMANGDNQNNAGHIIDQIMEQAAEPLAEPTSHELEQNQGITELTL